MSKTLRVLVIAVVALAGAGFLVWAFVQGRGERAAERERERPVTSPARTSRGPGGEIVVTLDAATRARVGIETRELEASATRPEVVAYGTLQEDPARSFTLRAPVAGTLRPAAGHDWPRIGAALADGAVAGVIEPRVAPATQVDLQTRLTSARGDEEAAAAALAAARAAYERARTLNAEGKIVSDKALQDAEAQLKSQQARLEAARANVALLTRSLAASRGPTGPMPLTVVHGGEVMEVTAQPGEAIESGQPVLRVARFETLVARVDVPPDEPIAPGAATARLLVVGLEDRSLTAERIGLAATDPRTQGQTWLFRVAANGLPLRPGQAVTAYLSAPGPERPGVVVPRSAIVRFQGQAWVYVAVGADRFTRRQITLDHPTSAGWLVTSGVAPGDRVIVEGPQVLLSEELRSQIQIGD